MKASELMIGDWVYDTHSYNYNKGKEPIKLDRNEFVELICGCTGNNDLDLGDMYEPIPLTEDMLEMNGFEIYEYGDPLGCVWYIKGTTMLFETTSLPTRYWNKWTMTDVSHTPRMGILSVQYVHELQRVLRCCGLWELANNFKI